MSVRLALSVIAACLTAVSLYAILRVAQALIFPEPNPALVLWSEHAGYFWRAWIVAYTGGMAGFVTWVLAARAPDETARVLAAAVVPSAALLVAQGLLVP